MFLIKPKYEIITKLDRDNVLTQLEVIGRVCWKSEGSIKEGSAAKFCSKLMGKNHLSVIEHVSMTVKFTVDRGVTHELVRHRLCSVTQESTRYVKLRDAGITFIIPPWVNLSEGEYTYIPNWQRDGIQLSFEDQVWLLSLLNVETDYNTLIDGGWTPQQARSILPNALKAEIYVTANLREWKHIFDLRCELSVHPQMREVMVPLRDEMRALLPEIFG